MERRVEEKTVAKVNEIMPDLAQRIAAYIAGGQTGPLPLLSLGASNRTKRRRGLKVNHNMIHTLQR
jgi:hypothetical protein